MAHLKKGLVLAVVYFLFCSLNRLNSGHLLITYERCFSLVMVLGFFKGLNFLGVMDFFYFWSFWSYTFLKLHDACYFPWDTFAFSQVQQWQIHVSLIGMVYLLLKVRNHLEDLVAKLTLEDQLNKEVLVFELLCSFIYILLMKVLISRLFVHLEWYFSFSFLPVWCQALAF